jgi:predicted dehydrogenase
MKAAASTPHSPKLRVGIIGAGAIVRQRHLPALLKMPGVEVLAVSNSSYASAERFCADHLPHATPIKHWAELLSVEELDIIWIGAPPYLHATVAISALEAGKHVFCQARMSMNLDEAHDMLEAAHHHPQLVTMLCPAPHGLKGDLVMRKLLAEETIGPIHSVRLRSLSGQYLNPDAPAHWRQRVEINGLNALTLGIYTEVLQRWLGPIAAVQARARIVYPEREGYLVRIPDILNVLCTFENGAEGVLAFSGVAAGAPTDRLELHGRDGTLTYDFSNDHISLFYAGSSSSSMVDIPPELAVNWRVEEDFFAAVRSHGQMLPRPSFEDGVAYMRVIQAVTESVVKGCEVPVAH